jgi:predicted RNA-binding Zn-ribbon protein involved in translation (DUF1610 family)
VPGSDPTRSSGGTYSQLRGNTRKDRYEPFDTEPCRLFQNLSQFDEKRLWRWSTLSFDGSRAPFHATRDSFDVVDNDGGIRPAIDTGYRAVSTRHQAIVHMCPVCGRAAMEPCQQCVLNAWQTYKKIQSVVYRTVPLRMFHPVDRTGHSVQILKRGGYGTTHTCEGGDSPVAGFYEYPNVSVHPFRDAEIINSWPVPGTGWDGAWNYKHDERPWTESKKRVPVGTHFQVNPILPDRILVFTDIPREKMLASADKRDAQWTGKPSNGLPPNTAPFTRMGSIDPAWLYSVAQKFPNATGFPPQHLDESWSKPRTFKVLCGDTPCSACEIDSGWLRRYHTTMSTLREHEREIVNQTQADRELMGPLFYYTYSYYDYSGPCFIPGVDCHSVCRA